MLDFRNVNTLWGSVLVETFHRLGLTTAIICPGSRSTPLTVAFAQHSYLETIPILDERSAAFFALGIGKKLGQPIVLVCTSGTAGANFYPAVIEAKESHVPLIILTADRPPQLRNCHAGQTIDQLKLYGNYPNWQAELALPVADLAMLRYLRQNIIHAWERASFPIRGVVHLNLPFDEPLAPIIQPEIADFKAKFPIQEFFSHISTPIVGAVREIVALRGFPPLSKLSNPKGEPPLHLDINQWRSKQKGIIIAGLAQPNKAETYCQAIAYLSQILQFPVLAEALSPLRNYASLNPYLVSTYDLILRNTSLAEQLIPEIVIQIGELPTSKQLRSWLGKIKAQRWIIEPTSENFDSLHGNAIHLRFSVEELSTYSAKEFLPNKSSTNYLKQWLKAENSVIQAIRNNMDSLSFLYEGKTAWLLSQYLPPNTPLFIANSMSVRNAEFFWQPNDGQVIPYFNRGANGIDGTLSTALGIAHRHQSSVLLTGDLALLHDTNGFLINNHFQGHLTIILINNNGGGIFEMLPISQFDPPFEDYFATPQAINFEKLCLTHTIGYQLIKNWQQLQQLINPLPQQGIRLLELQTNRKSDTLWLKSNLPKFAENI
ncbi:MAG: 2-succinyl-5-enolpyruvyl-6-hydroxy-3-cyclohexene-1-carboxylic-acid synthase [Xenococcaceae cyanobacterium MO_188.B29]|nr:2-succinyl-5-enolpyruvyl-6-hydroxy-3-cyclohexene-1-carboxylic-acid synthase [Xenococcaceae cyanobacterium MO_188.B29]